MQTEKQIEFLKEIIKVCMKYKLWLDHEDQHGSFIISKTDNSISLTDAIPEEDYGK